MSVNVDAKSSYRDFKEVPSTGHFLPRRIATRTHLLLSLEEREGVRQ